MGKMARMKRANHVKQRVAERKTMAETIRRSAFLALYHDELCTALSLGNATPQQVVEKVKELVSAETRRKIVTL